MDCIFYLLAIFLGAMGAWIISFWGPKLELIDKPNERSSHKRPTPKGGGVGILAAFVLVSLIRGLSIPAIAAATTLALVSFRGDQKELTPRFRLTVQFSCAALALLGIGCELVPKLAWAWLPPLFPASLIFIVGTANFYNFMDGRSEEHTSELQSH